MLNLILRHRVRMPKMLDAVGKRITIEHARETATYINPTSFERKYFENHAIVLGLTCDS
jgi:hypothetical protein